MKNEFEIKAVIAKHMDNMIEELGRLDEPPGWFGDNAKEMLTEVVFGTLAYAKDVEEYLEKEGMLNP